MPGERIRNCINPLVYLSVALGVALFPQIYGNVPPFVFYSIVIGWVAYVATAVLVATGRTKAYLLVLVLAVVTLAVSLPQPEHYTFVSTGQVAAASTFITGSLLQICLIILIPTYWLGKKKHAERAG